MKNERLEALVQRGRFVMTNEENHRLLSEAVDSFLWWSSWMDFDPSRIHSVVITDTDGNDVHMGIRTFERLQQALKDHSHPQANLRLITDEGDPSK